MREHFGIEYLEKGHLEEEYLKQCIDDFQYSFIQKKNLVIPASEDDPIAFALDESKQTLRLPHLHLWSAPHYLDNKNGWVAV